MINKKRLRAFDEKGSASILLVVIMVTLLSLGVLSVASSYANYKIAKKNAAWNTAYYAQDGYYQSKLYELSELRTGYETTIDRYLQNSEYLNSETRTIPVEMHRKMQQYYKALVSRGLDQGAMDSSMKNQFVAHMTASALGLKTDFSKAIALSEEALPRYYQYTLPPSSKKTNERHLSVVVSLYGAEIGIMEYREVPVKFTYKEMEFTDIKE